MVTNNFNGRVYIETNVKSGIDTYDLELFFQDLTSFWRGRDCQVGDVVFCKGSDGRGYRLIVQSISKSSLNHISCTVKPESTTLRFIPPQYCAIVRETENRKYPMFPVNIPVSLRGIMLSYYAWLADFANEDCSSNLLTAANVTGDEILCGLKLPNGIKSGITLTELRKWMHTWTTPNGMEMQMNVLDGGQFNGITPPQY